MSDDIRVPLKIVSKVWGHEIIFADTEAYCGKLLHFDQGARASLHYHPLKDESWFVALGYFELELEKETMGLRPGDAVRLRPGTKHRLRCLRRGIIIEASTHDDPHDCVRLIPSEAAP